jgi:hypothetical protein
MDGITRGFLRSGNRISLHSAVRSRTQFQLAFHLFEVERQLIGLGTFEARSPLGFTPCPPRISPPHPHGTGMAGAIASHRRLLGIAPGAKLPAVRAFGIDEKGAQGRIPV